MTLGASNEPSSTRSADPPAIVRDRLAAIRTNLANERTLLSYLRTGLALLIGGATAEHFTTDPMITVLAFAVGLLGLIALVIGVMRYFAVRRLVRRTEADP